MKEYPMKLMNMKDLIRFQRCVLSNNLHGEIRQKNYPVSVRSGFYLAMALPLDDAILCLKDDCQVKEDVITRICSVSA